MDEKAAETGEELWKRTFSEGLDQDAEHHVLAQHFDQRTHRTIEEEVYDAAVALVPPGASLLDVGCGSGLFCRKYADRGHEAVGVDFSAELVAIAKRRYPDLEFRELDVYRCGELGRTFDLVVCAGVIQSVSDPARAFAGFAAVQAPGGKLSVCTRSRSFLGNLLTPVFSLLRQGRTLPFTYYTAGRLRELGRAAGYAPLESRFVYVFPGPLGALNGPFNRNRLLNRLAFPAAVHVLVTYERV